MKKVYSYSDMETMHFKNTPDYSPIISGVIRSGSIVITPSDVSSGIKSYHNCESRKNF